MSELLSDNMRAALAGKAIERSQPRSDSTSSRRPIGDRPCPQCGWLTSQFDYDEQANPTGPLYEHRIHGEHAWPQLHSCEPAPDNCPICKPCTTC